MKKIKLEIIIASVAGLLAAVGHAQWLSQNISLQGGWNAVFLQVEPESSDCDALFSNTALQVERVHAFDQSYNTVQFISNTNEWSLNNASWLRWFPTHSDQRPLRTLFAVSGGNPYFIKRADNASDITWTVKGRPRLNAISWRTETYNLISFQVSTSAPPALYDFFRYSSFSNQPIYRMNVAGTWYGVTNPASEFMRSGEAFWVQASQYSTYQGPVYLSTEDRFGIDFGKSAQEETLHFRNETPFPKTLHLRALASESAPAGTNYPSVAGTVPVALWSNGWMAVTSTVVKTLEAMEAWDARIAVRRAEMTPAAHTAIYQSLLNIRDDEGFSDYWIGVRAQNNPQVGMWVGSAVITNVNHVVARTNGLYSTDPIPTGVEFPFRVILHVDSNRNVRLLSEVFQMWKKGTYNTNGTVAVPGRYVWVTDKNLLHQFTGATLRDGEDVGRRISSVVFGFRNPLLMSPSPVAAFGTSGVALSCVVTQPFNDPRNPFLHRYHPDHDNRAEGYPYAPLPAGNESYAVTRNIALTFTAQDPENLALPGWGDSQVGGIWEERVQGLRHQDLFIRGYFRLTRISDVGVLNE